MLEGLDASASGTVSHVDLKAIRVVETRFQIDDLALFFGAPFDFDPAHCLEQFVPPKTKKFSLLGEFNPPIHPLFPVNHFFEET